MKKKQANNAISTAPKNRAAAMGVSRDLQPSPCMNGGLRYWVSTKAMRLAPRLAPALGADLPENEERADYLPPRRVRRTRTGGASRGAPIPLQESSMRVLGCPE
jgi:hypothetical protein